MTKPTHKPGTYCDVRDEYGAIDPRHYVYGHLTADEWRSAVVYAIGEDDADIPPDYAVEHLYARSVFAPNPDGPGDRAWMTSPTYSRGAMKVTALKER